MTHLTPIRQFSRMIAVTFATSILAVVACDFICGLDPTFAFNCQNHLSPAHAETVCAKKIHHGQNHDHLHQSGPETTVPHSHDHSSDEHSNGDCCEDLTNQFYQSLFKTNDAANSNIPMPAVVLFTALTPYKYLLIEEEYQNSLRIPPKRPPPSAGGYIRILISSFLI